ncbi:hypothetical protein [Nocardia africana]|uniref:hypothetical protein n=1 Tax=Nocardia africana TaxID=134964 RepID=UPI0035A6F7CF
MSVFTARRAARDQRQRLSGRGLRACSGLDCRANVNRAVPLGPLDPPADELIRQRRDGLRSHNRFPARHIRADTALAPNAER